MTLVRRAPGGNCHTRVPGFSIASGEKIYLVSVFPKSSTCLTLEGDLDIMGGDTGPPPGPPNGELLLEVPLGYGGGGGGL